MCCAICWIILPLHKNERYHFYAFLRLFNKSISAFIKTHSLCSFCVVQESSHMCDIVIVSISVFSISEFFSHIFYHVSFSSEMDLSHLNILNFHSHFCTIITFIICHCNQCWLSAMSYICVQVKSIKYSNQFIYDFFPYMAMTLNFFFIFF